MRCSVSKSSASDAPQCLSRTSRICSSDISPSVGVAGGPMSLVFGDMGSVNPQSPVPPVQSTAPAISIAPNAPGASHTHRKPRDPRIASTRQTCTPALAAKDFRPPPHQSTLGSHLETRESPPPPNPYALQSPLPSNEIQICE